MTTDTVYHVPGARVAERLWPTLATIATVVCLGDLLFWAAPPGASVGVFAMALGILLFMQRGERSRASLNGVTILLLTLSCAQASIELCFTNVVVLFVLLVALMGETFYASIGRYWARWSEAAFALLSAPLGWWSLSYAVNKSALFTKGATTIRAGERFGRLFRIAFPAVALALVFGVILSFGNAVLNELFGRIATHALRWLLTIHFSFNRLMLWIGLATIAIGFFWPPGAASHVRWWTRSPQRWVRSKRVEAIWQSGLALLVLNGLFFAANTIDVIYLWHKVELPAGVTFSEFVHEGVYSLIGAVLLSAVVLTVIFQQSREVAETRLLKVLAHFWIAQNAVLIGGVLLRLKIYVDAYQLTELRFYVGAFLLLVATGFAVLAWYVQRGMNFDRLLFANAGASFALFFAMQFADVRALVANYNVTAWERDSKRILDLDYLMSLGPSAWPAVRRLADDRRQPWVARDTVRRLETAAREEQRARPVDWRSWQARREMRRRWLLAEAKKL